MQIPMILAPRKSPLDEKNAPKRRFGAISVLNNGQIPQGHYWRRYLFSYIRLA